MKETESELQYFIFLCSLSKITVILHLMYYHPQYLRSWSCRAKENDCDFTFVHYFHSGMCALRGVQEELASIIHCSGELLSSPSVRLYSIPQLHINLSVLRQNYLLKNMILDTWRDHIFLLLVCFFCWNFEY